MPDSDPGKLTQNQAMGVTVALLALERILFSIEELYEEQTGIREGVMVSLTNPLTSEERAHLAGVVEQARATIATLAERFDLPHETVDLAKEAHGRLVEMWATLEDTRSTKLRRYGRVDPALSTSLDPEIENLIQLVLQMDGKLFAARPGGQAGSLS